ncbi:MAG TPA: aminotransferase class V-fold PLP-dependent enzyme [Burkholderiaceae bacterium]|nr:aminotransferase class V-fold PLP-dependent enzyme [Burkholderiaceae bacterium]
MKRPADTPGESASTATLTAERVAALRADTPGCEHRLHLNTAGAGLPSRRVLAATTDHLMKEALEGPVEAAIAAQARLDETRNLAAALINARPADVAWASSCSHAWGVAFAALPPLRPGQRMLVSRHEWGGNVATLARAALRAGCALESIPCADDGGVDAAALARLIDQRVALVALTWLPANGGLINDAAAVGQVTRAAGVPLLIDAAQAVGQMPVDVQAIGCDVLVAPGRKHLRGPRGTALLYVRPSLLRCLDPAFLDVAAVTGDHGGRPQLSGDASMLETGETTVAGLLGLREALALALEIGPAAIAQRVRALAEQLRAGLAAIAGVTVRDLGTVRSALVSFTIEGVSATRVQQQLAARRINIGANGVAYTPLDMRVRGLTQIARMSVSYLTTPEEIEWAVAAVAAVAHG